MKFIVELTPDYYELCKAEIPELSACPVLEVHPLSELDLIPIWLIQISSDYPNEESPNGLLRLLTMLTLFENRELIEQIPQNKDRTTAWLQHGRNLLELFPRKELQQIQNKLNQNNLLQGWKRALNRIGCERRWEFVLTKKSQEDSFELGAPMQPVMEKYVGDDQNLRELIEMENQLKYYGSNHVKRWVYLDSASERKFNRAIPVDMLASTGITGNTCLLYRSAPSNPLS